MPLDGDIILTDASPEMVREAASRLRGSPHPFAFAAASAEAIPFEASTFDLALAHLMLYHVADRSRAFGEIARVLRPGGMLHAATNGARHMREAKVLAARAGLLPDSVAEAGDATGFSLDDGATQLEAWFDDVELRRYEDALVVTEAEPLLSYILSTGYVQAHLNRETLDAAKRRVDALRAILNERLAAEGQIRITKETGVFIARRA